MVSFEHSAGAVIFYKRGRREPLFLLLRYAKHLGRRWDFPKGAVEKGERLAQAMRREVREETGVRHVRIWPGFYRRISWSYQRSGKQYHKTVEFLLVESPTMKVKLSPEHSEFSWLAYKAALARLKHKNAKEVLERAYRFLRHWQSN